MTGFRMEVKPAWTAVAIVRGVRQAIVAMEQVTAHPVYASRMYALQQFAVAGFRMELKPARTAVAIVRDVRQGFVALMGVTAHPASAMAMCVRPKLWRAALQTWTSCTETPTVHSRMLIFVLAM